MKKRIKKIKLKGIDFDKCKPVVKICVNKFFYSKLPLLREMSEAKDLKKKHKGHTINSLGVEGTQEEIYRLFKEGKLQIAIIDESNYFVYSLSGKRMNIIHKVENDLILI